MKVAILIPGGVFTPDHVDSMFKLAFRLGVDAGDQAGYRVGYAAGLKSLGQTLQAEWPPSPEVIYRRIYCPVVHHGRNLLLLAGQDPAKDAKVLAGWDYDKILWLETDMVFKVEDIMHLLEDDGDVVSGIYPMGPELPDVAVAGLLPDQRLVISNLHRHPQDLIEVDFCGLGIVAVRRGVFESLPYPWFHTLYNGSEYIGDDFGWCADVKAKGFKIYVDRRVRAGHQKTVIV